MDFNEPLSPQLSGAKLYSGSSNTEIRTRVFVDARAMRLTPISRLPRGPYRVDWRAVSSFDGHPVEGSFGFGVRAPPPTINKSLNQDPLDQNGVSRITARAVFYAAMLFFVGGLLVAALWLPRSREPGEEVGIAPSELTGRSTLTAGAVAVFASVVVLLLDTANAGGTLNGSTFVAYAIENVSGRARAVTTILLVLALIAAWRSQLKVAVACVLGATAMTALSGHANSADPRAVSLVTDWLHLIAGSIWIGGMTHMALIVRRAHKRADRGDDTPLLPTIDRFGELAVPAFLATVVTGLYNTAIEIGSLSALWSTSYGRVLTLKIAFVVVLIGVSALHSRFLRPAAAEPGIRGSRLTAYWRLIANEPLLAAVVVILAATLAVFPLPPRQSQAADGTSESQSCSECLEPAAGQASFADQAGSTVVGAWMRKEQNELVGELRTFDSTGRPVARNLRLTRGKLADPCGIGCRRFYFRQAGSQLTGLLTEDQTEYEFRLPAEWSSKSAAQVRRAVRAAQTAMQRTRSLRADERINVTATAGTRTAFEARAPDRLIFSAANGAAGVIIGRRRWARASADAGWTGPTLDTERFRTANSFDWVANAKYAWELPSPEEARTQRLAVMNPAEPVWYELLIDRRSGLVTDEKMTSPGHFMNTRYFDFNAPIRINPPR